MNNTTHKPKINDYFSLVTFSHTIFALPFAVIGFLLAVDSEFYEFSLKTFILVILCMVFARSAAMGFNRYADRHIDVLNPRTKEREIPSGKVSPQAALIFIIANCLAFIVCTYYINPICFYLSPIALGLILGYSITKRYTAFCHLVLGLALSLAPVGAWLAVRGRFEMLPIAYGGVVLFWVAGFDMIYALQDQDFDKKNNLHSIPALIGDKATLRLARIFHFISGGILVAIMALSSVGVLHVIGTLAFCALLYYQHTLVKPGDLSKVNRAFFTTNGIASVIFSCFVIADIYIWIPIPFLSYF